MNGRPWMIGLLVIMAVVCSSALALVNLATSPIIEMNRELAYKSTVLDVFGIQYNASDPETVLSTYESRIREREEGGLTMFEDTASGARAVFLEGNGFQGPMELVVALDGGTITGFKVVSQEETPGLGARITEEEFQQSLVGKEVSDGIEMVRTGDAGPGGFDAITGATETSRALERILNRGFERYFDIID